SGDQNPTRLGLGYVAVPTRPGEIVQIDGATGRRVPGAKARVQRVVASTGAHGQPRALGEQLEHGPRVVVEAPGFPQVDRYLVADTVVASDLPERFELSRRRRGRGARQQTLCLLPDLAAPVQLGQGHERGERGTRKPRTLGSTRQGGL